MLNVVVFIVVIFQNCMLMKVLVLFQCELIHKYKKPYNLPWTIISNLVKRNAADQGIYRPLKIIREEIVNASAELTQLLLNNNKINQI